MNQATPPLRAAIIPVTPLQQNCTLIWCTKTMRGTFTDPGGDLAKLKAAASHAGVTIEKILLTHGHIDHCGSAGILAAELGVPIEGPHKDDIFWISKLEEDGQRWGITGKPFEPDRWLEDGDTVTVGELTFNVRHCPGHTPGHVVFHHPESKLAIVGDVLFKGSIGRWDFPMGNHQQLIEFNHPAPLADGRGNEFHPRPRSHVDLRPRTRDQPSGGRPGVGRLAAAHPLDPLLCQRIPDETAPDRIACRVHVQPVLDVKVLRPAVAQHRRDHVDEGQVRARRC